MDFYEHQERARRRTVLLVCLFVAATGLLITLTNLLVAAVVFVGTQPEGLYSGALLGLDPSALWQRLSWQQLGLTSLVVIASVGAASGFKWMQLSGGGRRVAQSLGGRRLLPDTLNPDERRVLNVVEEMAIAAGLPVPAVYLLEHEQGINAFAAGINYSDAVIGVTAGAVAHFDRDQLQGVIAHEFSHILNGDMRLNSRLIALVAGIIFISEAGRLLLHGSHRGGSGSTGKRSGTSISLLLGLALLLLGMLGRFLGQLIKAAVSRQREFLADASAVQFTRNPAGIAGALKVIGGYNEGSRIDDTHANELSHLFFGDALGHHFSLFDTHPALAARISRIDPHWDGRFAAVAGNTGIPNQQQASATVNAFAATGAPALEEHELADQPVEPSAGEAVGPADRLPPMLDAAAHQPFTAMALVFALVLHRDDDRRFEQLLLVQRCEIKGLDRQLVTLWAQIRNLGREHYLVLAEMSLPALRGLSDRQYSLFKRTLLQLIRADRETELGEWCLYQVVCRNLDSEFGKVRPSLSAFKRVEQVAAEFQLVLSLLAHEGSRDEACATAAFARGCQTAGLTTVALLPREHCTFEAFNQAVSKLYHCYPLLKPRLLKGLSDCATEDGRLDPVEREIVTAIAAALDTPMPRLRTVQQVYGESTYDRLVDVLT